MMSVRALLPACALLALVAGQVSAGGTPDQKCAAAKNKAASKKIAAKLKCWEKALGSGAATADSGCLSAAEQKFTQAIQKAEAKGGCAVTGDGPTIETAVDTCVANIVALTPTGGGGTTTTTGGPTTTTTTTLIGCCSGGGTCLLSDNVDCVGQGGTFGASGTVCDGATGTCKATASPGNCCQVPGPGGLFACIGGPGITSPECTSISTGGFGTPVFETGKVCTFTSLGCQ
jgi:hypothetical protein